MISGLVLAWLSAGTAVAGFGQARLVSGEPEFPDCLASTSCADNFYDFLGLSMLEQGHAMQPHAVAHSALHNPRAGWVVGGALATFPFAPPRENLSGKEENTDFSPVFPHIRGSRLMDTSDGRRSGFGLSFVPPVTVGGASAFSLGLAGSTAWLEDGGARGFELEIQALRAHAPIAATDDQFENRDSFTNMQNLDEDTFEENCGSTEGGCVDRFDQLSVGFRAGRTWTVGEVWHPYAKVGLNLFAERLWIMYDDTLWSVLSIPPSAHAGIGWSPGEHLFLATGGTVTLRYANQSPDDLGVFYKVEGSLGWAI